jgi:DNA-directed RNA polymerase specialized sigma24 family protein
MAVLSMQGNALVGRSGRHYGGRAMAHRDQESEPELARIELRLDAEGHPDADDRAALGLIARACAGDAVAVSALVKTLLPTVRAVVRARLNSGAPSGDDGEVLRRWDGERGLPLPRFVALIADRFTLSELRVRRATDQALPIGDYADVLPDEGEEPESWMQNRQALVLMFEAITARLSPLGRRLFKLLFVEEQTIEEICLDTGMGADAVYAWRSRLRRKAAQLLHLLDVPEYKGAR